MEGSTYSLLANLISAVVGGLLVFFIQTFGIEWRNKRRAIKKIRFALQNLSAPDAEFLRFIYSKPAKITDWLIKDLGTFRALEKSGVIECLTPELESCGKVVVVCLTELAVSEIKKNGIDACENRKGYGDYHSLKCKR